MLTSGELEDDKNDHFGVIWDYLGLNPLSVQCFFFFPFSVTTIYIQYVHVQVTQEDNYDQ